MKQISSRLYESNPFSTRYVRPGAIDFLFPQGVDCDLLVTRLAECKWWGAIVGPHGCGKSTLLATLLPVLEQRGCIPRRISLHDEQRWMPRGWCKCISRDPHCKPLLVIDGYEQLNLWSRWLVRHRCRRNGWGLLITTHREVTIPTLIELQGSLPTLRTVVDRLLPQDVRSITPADVAAAFQSAHGNLRDALFDLYDRYERTSRPKVTAD
jgi:hypothetical protein